MIYQFYLKEWILEKVEKIIGSLYDKNEFFIQTRNLKQASNHGFYKSSKSLKSSN